MGKCHSSDARKGACVKGGRAAIQAHRIGHEPWKRRRVGLRVHHPPEQGKTTIVVCRPKFGNTRGGMKRHAARTVFFALRFQGSSCTAALTRQGRRLGRQGGSGGMSPAAAALARPLTTASTARQPCEETINGLTSISATASPRAAASSDRRLTARQRLRRSAAGRLRGPPLKDRVPPAGGNGASCRSRPRPASRWSTRLFCRRLRASRGSCRCSRHRTR